LRAARQEAQGGGMAVPFRLSACQRGLGYLGGLVLIGLRHGSGDQVLRPAAISSSRGMNIGG